MKQWIERNTKIIISLTCIILVGLSFLATPFVFNGLLMNRVWDIIRLIIFVILIIELATLNIHSFPMCQRVLIWTFIVITILARTVISERFVINLLLVYNIASIYIVIKESKSQSFSRNRLFYIMIFGLLYVLSSILNIQLIDKNSFLLIGLAGGLVMGVILLLVILLIVSKHKDQTKFRLEIALSFVLLSPLIFFILLNTINYSFDLSDPDIFEYEIVELKIETGFRKPIQYRVYFEIEGNSYYVSVTQNDYYKYQVGDMIEVKVYQGFLNEPYRVNE